MKEQELIKRAEGDSVSEDVLTENIISELFEEEIPHQIFKFPTGFNTDKSFEWNVGINESGKYNYKLVVTTDRIILAGQKGNITVTEWYPLSEIQQFSFGSPGLISTLTSNNNVKIKLSDTEITGGIYRKTKKSDLEWAKAHIEDANKQPNITELYEPDAFGDVTDRAVVEDISVTEAYGYHIDNESYNIVVCSSGIAFEKDPINQGNYYKYEIPKEEIYFEEISTTESKDLSTENLGRYVNQINPLLDDAAPAKKKKKSLIKIPLYQGEGYITLETENSKDIRIMLNSLNKLRNPTKAKNEKEAVQSNSETKPMEILKRRLAEGEISPEEFEKRKEYLQ